MILEGIVTTVSQDGMLNVSPMGPRVDESMQQLVLQPYQTSTTYENLKRVGQGVFHVVDNVELIAHTAVGQWEPSIEQTISAVAVTGRVLKDACRWYEFRVRTLDDSAPRTKIVCDVVHQGRLRDFVGFNRAKHAVVEAAILATRTEFLAPEEIKRQYRSLSILVDKTAGPQERRAFKFLLEYVERVLGRDFAPNEH